MVVHGGAESCPIYWAGGKSNLGDLKGVVVPRVIHVCWRLKRSSRPPCCLAQGDSHAGAYTNVWVVVDSWGNTPHHQVGSWINVLSVAIRRDAGGRGDRRANRGDWGGGTWRTGA